MIMVVLVRKYYILSNEVVDMQSISLRNNPIIEILEIINPENIKNLEFSVLDLTGKRLINRVRDHKIDVSSFRRGVYLLIIENTLVKTKSIIKFIKE